MEKSSFRYITQHRVVLLCGVSGSGKTFLSHLLEKQNFVRVSADNIIWQRYGDAFLDFPQQQRKEVFQSLGKELCEETIAHISAGEKVVVDSTMCKRAKRDEMRMACRAYGVEPVLVWLNTSSDLLRSRLSARKGNGPDDQIVTSEQLTGFLTGFESPTPDENPIIYSSESAAPQSNDL